MAIYDARTRLRAQVRTLLTGAGIPDTAEPECARSPLIDPSTLPLSARRVHGRLVAGGLRVYLRDVTSETRIATFMCIVSEDIGKGQHRPHGGYGCHPDARVAALRALTEAATSRVACIQGGREDLPEVVGGRAFIPDADLAFGGGPTGSFADVPSVEFSSVAQTSR